MIGQAAWFQRRKYGGWGITPKSKEGWLYVVGAIILLVVFQNISQYLFIGGLAILLADVLHIMILLKKDEFETKAEAIAERNGAYAMIAVLVTGMIYQVTQQTLDPFLVAALFAGAIFKSLTNWHLDKQGLGE